MSSHDFDAIVVGGGHNGLTNAAYLGKAGLRTLVLEKNDLVGGAAITERVSAGTLPSGWRTRTTASATAVWAGVSTQTEPAPAAARAPSLTPAGRRWSGEVPGR